MLYIVDSSSGESCIKSYFISFTENKIIYNK